MYQLYINFLFLFVMVQLYFNLTFTCTILMCCPLIFVCYSHVNINDRNDMPVDENNTSKFSKSEFCHKYKEKPYDITWPKPYLKVLYNVYTLLFMESMILQWTISTWRC